MDTNVKKLKVNYNGQIVGYLLELDDTRIAFQYDDEWLLKGFSLNPFFLPLNNKVFISKSTYFSGLFGVFYDSLPDGWGELLVRRMVTKKRINFDKLSALTRLTLVSANGLGALQFAPVQNDNKTEKIYDLDVIAKEIKNILNDVEEKLDIDEIFNLGGSSGGEKPKVHLRIYGQEWIVKFPAQLDPKNTGELEYTANQVAEKSGINVNVFKLYPSKQCTGYFGAKRFDRVNGKRVHMIALSSLLETTHKIPTLDYKHLFQVIQEICFNQEDLYEAFRRMVFNVLYPNRDDHGKNFAFLYNELKKGYELSPAYDLTKTPRIVEHQMTVLGEGNPKVEDLLKLSSEFNMSLKRCRDIITQVENAIL
ncbi:MAG: type II toxin-antitoxin system HipA family toxin [Candidatus Izemoplasma sp.]